MVVTSGPSPFGARHRYLLAQERLISLQCEGRADFYDKGLRNIPIAGLYLEIRNTAVKVAGSMWFDGDWQVTREDAATITFSPPNNASYIGSVNRYSGELTLSNMVQDKAKAILFANCNPAKKLF
ncbi:MAG: hypothetical protein EXQ90_04465 [Rhodospirillales bacterium]|nr:hypothetical protein [Rhodospirillales bacterium]